MDAILTVLNALPPSENPYAVLDGILNQQLKPPTVESFDVILRVCNGLFAVCALLCISSIVITVAGGNAWIYRWRDTPAGTLFVPNSALWFSVFMLLYLLQTQAWLVVVRECYFGRLDVFVTKYLACGAWLCFGLAFWVNAFEMSLSTFGRYSLRFTRFRAVHLHAFFALVPIYELITFAVFIHSASRVQKGNKILHVLDAQLKAQPWSAGQPFALNTTWVPTLTDFVDTINDFVNQEQAAYGLFTADQLLCCLVVLPATLVQIAILRGHSSHGQKAIDAYLANGRHSSDAQLLQSRQDQMRRTVWSLALQAIGVLLATFCITGVTAWVASDLRGVLSSGLNIEVAYALAFLTYGVLGIPVHALLLNQALRQWQKRKAAKLARTRNAAAGIMITTETEVAIDDGSDARSVNSMDMSDHLSIAMAAMRREKTGISHRARSTAFQQALGVNSNMVVVLPPTSDKEIGLDTKSSQYV